jgi:hypothetical protein
VRPRRPHRRGSPNKSQMATIPSRPGAAATTPIATSVPSEFTRNSSAEFRAALLKGVQAIRDHHVVGYVSDARKATVFVAEDMQWVSKVWLPQAVKAGLKRMAMVTAHEGLGKAIIEDVAKEIDNHGLSMRKFNSVAAATVWAQSGLGG